MWCNIKITSILLILYTPTVLYIMYANPYFLLGGRGMMEMWEAELLFWGVWVELTLCLSLSLLTSTGNRAIRNVPIPQCPLKHLHMYSDPICHSWECGGVSSYVPTSTDGTTPPLRGVSAPPEVTLLPYYSFIPSAWWIMMLLPYLVCCGNRARASIAHSVAFHLRAGSLLIHLLATPVHSMPGLNSLNRIPFYTNNQSPVTHPLLTAFLYCTKLFFFFFW